MERPSRLKRIAAWRQRHLNARAVIALIALGSLVVPGMVAVIDTALLSVRSIRPAGAGPSNLGR